MVSLFMPRRLLMLATLTHTSLSCLIAGFHYDQKGDRVLKGQLFETDPTWENLKCGLAIRNALKDGDGFENLHCLNGWSAKIGRDFGDYWWIEASNEWAPGKWQTRRFNLDLKDTGGDKRELTVQIYGCPGGANWQEAGIEQYLEYACADGSVSRTPCQ